MNDDACTANPDPQASIHRLRTASRWLRRGFTVLLALNIGVVAFIALGIAVCEVGAHLFHIHSVGADLICRGAKCQHAGPDMVAFSNALVSYKEAYYAGVLVLRGLPPILVLWQLRALCGFYQRGAAFSLEAVRHIRWIGVWIIVWAAVPTLAHLALAPAGADLNGYFKDWSDPTQIILFIVGVGVLLAAQVAQVGHHIEDERSQFV